MTRDSVRWPLLVLTAMGLAWAGCGGGRPDAGVKPDAVVRVAVTSPTEMPFHGPGGPGTEPMYIGFTWTVAVTASEGADSQVGTVRTRLVESASGTVLPAEGGPLGTLAGGSTLELAQGASGFFPSSLYSSGKWSGTTTVEVIHGGGRSETLTATFSFR